MNLERPQHFNSMRASERWSARLSTLSVALIQKPPTDQVIRVSVALVVFVLLFTIIHFAPPTRPRLVGSSCLLLAVIAIYGLLLYLNGSYQAFLAILRRPKTWLIFALLAMFAIVNFMAPTYGFQSYVDTTWFVFVYVGVLFFDAMIDRHRAIVGALVFVMIGVTLYKLYAWTLTERDIGIVVFELFGKSVEKRKLARSLLFSLLLQLVEGVTFMVRNLLTPAHASFHTHFIFIRQLSSFTAIENQPPGPLQTHTFVGFILALIMVTFISLLLFISYAYPHDYTPDWLFGLSIVACIGINASVFFLYYRNFSVKVARALLSQPNIWVLIVLTAFYLPSELVKAYPATIPFAVSLTVGVLGFIATDTFRVTNTSAVAWLGLVGMASMIGPLIDYTFTARGQDIVLFDHTTIRVTKNDVLTTISVNYVIFFAEGVVAAVRYRKTARKCVFVRALVPRGTVLFTQIHTPNAFGMTTGKYSQIQDN